MPRSNARPHWGSAGRPYRAARACYNAEMDENPYKSPIEPSLGSSTHGTAIKRRWPAYYVLSSLAGAVAVAPLMEWPSNVSAVRTVGACVIISGFHVTVGFALFGLYIRLRNWLRGLRGEFQCTDLPALAEQHGIEAPQDERLD